MPMVYDLPTVDTAAQPSQQFAAPETKNYAGEQIHEQGNALTKANAVAINIAQDMQNTLDTAAAKEADNKLADIIRTTMVTSDKAYLKTAGKAAVDGLKPIEQTLREAAAGIEPGLSNKVQIDMFKKAATTRLQTALGQAGVHALEQAKVYEAAVSKARADGFSLDATNNWAGWKETNSIYSHSKASMLVEVDQKMSELGLGKNDPIYKAAVLDRTTTLHTDTINLMISLGKTTDAKEYFNANVMEIAANKRDELQTKVRTGTVATEGDNMATQIWKELAPGGLNGAVPIFDMEQRARELAGDNEEVQKAAIAGLRERAAGFNAQQTEFKSQNIAKVWKNHDQGMGLNQIKLTPEWNQLTGKEQHEIKAAMEAEAATRAARAASNSAREYTDAQRKELFKDLKNGGMYNTITDPNVLRKMTRAQVEATRTYFSPDKVQHLLDRWDNLQNPAKFKEAQWETDSFKAAVRGLGMNPDSKNKDERDRIGALKYHVEQRINHALNMTKTPMTPEQKDAFIRNELSNQVLINPGAFSFNKKVPIVSLTNKQINQVVIPAGDRKAVTDAMSRMYKQTGNKEFAPSEYNMKIWYLRSKSPGFSSFQGE